MRFRLVRGMAATFLLAAAGGALAVEPAEETRLARLVERLGDASFREREAADAELARLGPTARDTLVAALTSGDVEVRIRARKLLERLAVDELWAGTHFDPPADAQPPGALFAAVMAQTGNRLLLSERYAVLPETPLQLTPGRRRFWPVMDELCGLIDCRFRGHYELLAPGIAVVSGSRGQNPVAYAGPLRAQLTTARRVFQEDFDYAAAAGERQYSFQLHLDLVWEDVFHLVAHRAQPVLIRATTPDGREVSSEQPTGGAWHAVSAGTHQASASLRLHPPPMEAAQFSELALAWELIAVGDAETIAMDPRADHQTHYSDDAAVTVIDCRIDKAGRVELEVSVARDLPIPDPAEILVHENRLALFDASGAAYRSQGQSHAITPDGVTYKLTYLPPTSTSQPERLNVTYPRIRSRRTLELVFQDVPLPHVRPE